MAQLGIMIEGQDGLNWIRWQRILQAAEDFGFQCVFRSDHFTNASGEDKDSLELWVSLTYAASHTSRIEFGSLVAPVTFRHPAMTVRMAAAVDDLSDGRLVLGLGAGWQEREHKKFGLLFYDFPTRYAMFEEALEITKRLLESDHQTSYKGQYFSLEQAVLLPRPKRRTPILIGGNGPKHTLPLVARYADEWNAVYLPLEIYKERFALLDELLKAAKREPTSVKRSLMTGTLFAQNDAELQHKLDEMSQKRGETVTVQSLQARGLIVGTPSMFVDQLNMYAQAGVERFMLQWLDQDDIAGLERLAKDVMPYV
ncbi:MAG: TIGR03560 family F420-dependent LLM class oxidoreductase [Chloroflexi bacterium]|nr:MAG: TIGR03560 family F420-dependent LLM class oxidoreductase [Chloroflexota bacterium]